MTGDSVPFAEQGFSMAHVGGKVHGKFVVSVSGNDVEISEECSTHAVDVEYSGLVPVLPSVPGTDGLTLTNLSGGHQCEACVRAEANCSPLCISCTHVLVVIGALVEVVV